MIIGTAAQAADLFAPLFTRDARERVAVIHVDSDCRLLALTLEASGSHDETELPIGAIISKALRIGSTAIVVAHNHPSGNPEPSAEDEAATRALATAAAGVSIRLHDHIIFGGGDCRSFRKLGLL
jgi:DNA repair protein RadC